jgi:hypothetical protein
MNGPICFFGDDSSLKSAPALAQDDVFLLGGYHVQGDRLKTLESEIARVKSSYSCPPEFPVKWNFRDLEPFYQKLGQVQLYQTLLPKMDTVRADLLNLLQQFNAVVVVAVIKGYSPRNLQKRREYHGWALADILQRLAMDCGTCPAAAYVNAIIQLDWPGSEVKKAHFDVFHSGYYKGTDYKAGALRGKGFFPDLTFGSTEHNPFLQLADITLGACADFIKWCCTGRKFQRVRAFYPLVSKQLRSVFSYDEFQTGLVISPQDFLQQLIRRRADFLEQCYPTPSTPSSN